MDKQERETLYRFLDKVADRLGSDEMQKMAVDSYREVFGENPQKAINPESCTYGWCTGFCHMRICGDVYPCTAQT